MSAPEFEPENVIGAVFTLVAAVAIFLLFWVGCLFL